MATSFPTSLDALSNPVSGDALSSPSHADQHANANDAIEALQAKVGITSSADTASLDYKVELKANLASPTFTGTPTLPTGTIATTQTVGNSSTAVATTAFVAAEILIATPIGMVTAYAGSTAPTEWQLCYGQAISRTTYASLFGVISTTYGIGDGSTTFNVPDLRGRTVAGLDNMGGTDAGRLSTANTLGTTTGTETVTLTSAESGVPAHSHANTLTNNAVTSGSHSADHSHTFTTGTVSSDHSHTTDAQGNHGHTLNMRTGAASSTHTNTNEAMAAGGTYTNSGVPISANGSHSHTTGGISANHTHSGTTSGMNVGHTHSVTSNVTITNANNTAANAASAHSNMQPTMTINYIIFAGA